MTFDDLRKMLTGDALLGRQHLNELMALSERYPYCAPLHSLVLNVLHSANDLRYATELHRRALNFPDLSHLYTLLQAAQEAQGGYIKSGMLLEHSSGGESAFDLVDAFLASHPDDAAAVELLLADTNDSLLYWSGEEVPTLEPVSVSVTDSLIDDFLKKGEEAERLPFSPSSPLPETSTDSGGDAAEELASEPELLTETLARIYIKQGRYENAKRIISLLNLHNPKKSSYFAEQIDYLDRLIQNNSL